jgi:integrase
MATKNLTRAIVAAFAYDPAGPSRQVIWDAKVSGFGVRATPAGGKQYVLSYRFNGRPRLMSLGALDHFETLEEARDKARALLHGLRHDGIDPMSDRQRLSSAADIGALWEIYEAEHLVKLSFQTRKNLKTFWGRHIKPVFQHLKATQVTSSDLIRFHDRVTLAAGPVSANRCVTRLSHFFNWLADRDEHLFPPEWKNPTRKVKVHKELPRSHFLTVEQMRLLFTALDAHKSPYFRAFLGMLLFTAARKNEVRDLKWSDVNLTERVARVKRTKNGKPLAMPLPVPAVRLLENLPRVAGNEHVFPAVLAKRSGKPMFEPRVRYKKLLKTLGLPEETTFHDLRRSVGTALAASGYSETMIAGVLNNTSTMAAKHYIHLANNVTRRIADEHAQVLIAPSAPTTEVHAAIAAEMPR